MPASRSVWGADITRTAPLAFPHPLHIHHDLVLGLPLDWTFSPEEVKAEGPAFTFTFAESYADRRLAYSYDLTSRAEQVTPEKLPEHLAAIDKARPWLVRGLTYKEPPPDGTSWPMVVASIAVLPLLGWGARKAYLSRPRLRVAQGRPDRRLSGTGGVLWIIGFRLLTGPLILLSSLRSSSWLYSTARLTALWSPTLPSYNPMLLVLAVVETPIMLAAAVYNVVVAILFFQRKRSFPFHFTVLVLGLIAFTLFDRLALSVVAKDRSASDLGEIIGSHIVGLLLLLYVRSSRRVATRFVVK